MPSHVDLLPIPLAVLSFQRDEFADYIHHLFAKLLQPTLSFFSLTLNDDQVSLLFDKHLSEDISIITSAEAWAVFSLDTDDHGLLELIQSLQAKSIQFMYQTSMSTDYLFVESDCIARVCSLLHDLEFIFSDEEDTYTPNKRRSRSRVPSRKHSEEDSHSQTWSLRTLPHTHAFHGLHTTQFAASNDWLLRLVQMLGWPDTLLTPSPSTRLPPPLPAAWRVSRARSESFRRPKLVSRHSADITNGGRSLLLAPRQDSLSSSYAPTSTLHSHHQSITLAQSSPPLYTSRPTSDTGLSLKEPKNEHKDILPFASLVIQRPVPGHRSGKDNEVRASIMARGRLLAKLFESSLLIGGCGDVAVSEDEADSETETMSKRARRGDDEGAFEMDDAPLPASSHSSNSLNDEGFKVLQISSETGTLSPIHILGVCTRVLDDESIEHHFTQTKDCLNILIPRSATKRAQKLLEQAING
ncbi:SubName: Full=Uncharacterized protein {ECO:0000313/EMBL:CCA73049.1} [Serendipita indica DSM 11827]|nr:SubName: Full=Uncharacterized protein {ECO:0000313/EMBL:CCA73049.1} [Serendipita indica DSM 11827]